MIGLAFASDHSRARQGERPKASLVGPAHEGEVPAVPRQHQSRSCSGGASSSARSGTPIHEDDRSSISTRQRLRRWSVAPSKYKYLAARDQTNRPSVTPLLLSHSRAWAENVQYCAGPPSIGTVANDQPSPRRLPQIEMRCPSGCHALVTFVKAVATLPSTSRGDDPPDDP